MAFSYEATHGTTFLYNKGLAGNVTIIRGAAQITVPGADLLEFLQGPEDRKPPYLGRSADAGATPEKPTE